MVHTFLVLSKSSLKQDFLRIALQHLQRGQSYPHVQLNGHLSENVRMSGAPPLLVRFPNSLLKDGLGNLKSQFSPLSKENKSASEPTNDTLALEKIINFLQSIHMNYELTAATDTLTLLWNETHKLPITICMINYYLSMSQCCSGTIWAAAILTGWR